MQSSPPVVVQSGPPTVAISFGMETYTAAEGGTFAMVSLLLDADPQRTVTIPLNVAFINGASSSDYAGLPASVTFLSGERTKSFALTAIDDNFDDDDECLLLTLGALPNAVIAGRPDAATILLQDNDRTVTHVEVSFNSVAYTAVEGRSAATVTVELDSDPKRMVTVPISVSPNGGAGTDDYSSIPASVSFNSGETAETFTVTANSDAVADNGETLTLTFGALPSGVSAGASHTATLKLAEHDSKLMMITASYDTATYLIAKKGGSATVTVELEANSPPIATARRNGRPN